MKTAAQKNADLDHILSMYAAGEITAYMAEAMLADIDICQSAIDALLDGIDRDREAEGLL